MGDLLSQEAYILIRNLEEMEFKKLFWKEKWEQGEDFSLTNETDQK